MLQLFAGEKIELRTYEEEDAQDLFALIDQNRSTLRTWLPWVDATLETTHSLEFIRQSKMDADRQSALALGIFCEGALAGGIGMHHWDHQLKKAEMGYWLATGHQGKGIVHLSAQALIAFMFSQLSLNKIELRYHPANKKSAAVAQRLHFTVEGVLRDAQLNHGMLHDLVVAGLLRREWKQ